VLADSGSKPMYYADTKPPLADIYKYFLTQETWDSLPVWEVDLSSLNNIIRLYVSTHPGAKSIGKHYLAADRPRGWKG
jgi:hypothetical protein